VDVFGRLNRIRVVDRKMVEVVVKVVETNEVEVVVLTFI